MFFRKCFFEAENTVSQVGNPGLGSAEANNS
jgi:hypothetical protein